MMLRRHACSYKRVCLSAPHMEAVGWATAAQVLDQSNLPVGKRTLVDVPVQYNATDRKAFVKIHTDWLESWAEPRTRQYYYLSTRRRSVACMHACGTATE